MTEDQPHNGQTIDNGDQNTMMIHTTTSMANTSPIASSGPKHIKAPVCNLPEMLEQATRTTEISKLLCSKETMRHLNPGTPTSSCCSPTVTAAVKVFEGDSCEKEGVNAMILTRQVSRQGRESQRWDTDEKTNSMVRLVTGCVPILSNGQILFVSASRKPEWILPKGGWETDETMEVSAIRECFEEAGVVGVVGPKLSEVEYETRKGKKRRLELEGLLKKQTKSQSEGSSSNLVPVSEDERPAPVKTEEASILPTSPNGKPPRAAHLMSDAAVDMIRGAANPLSNMGQMDETLSVVSDASNGHTHAKLTLFPLYVTDVKDKWPESGRLRRAMDIDEAIAMLESRPEFRKPLQEVKARGLHLLTNRR
eukprot:CAMPEP_0194046818 /NCGR_PEP_ID=MMETSP0009_2-20130614/22407_1 /TAXON_ID=210454 /ORGANISM="Grammatophora oceanica, Strain CCMP 410" /LENGTH=365 /DNA_ID=CAMNT_0038692249 /DNA_START=427 /DNA_END=1524 /DNA_ORIENTATION=+